MSLFGWQEHVLFRVFNHTKRYICETLQFHRFISKIRIGPQRAIAGVGTFKSGVGTSKAIHAIQTTSRTQVLELFPTSSCPRCPHHQLLQCSNFLIPHFKRCNMKIGGVGVGGMMTLEKVGAIVLDWRTRYRVQHYCAINNLEVPLSVNARCGTRCGPIRIFEGGSAKWRTLLVPQPSEKWPNAEVTFVKFES